MNKKSPHDQRFFFVDNDIYNLFLDLLETPINENLELQTLLERTAPWESQKIEDIL